MSNESDHTEKTRQLSVRGGDEDEPSKSGKKLIREMVAEMIGTFIIVQIGTASVMSGIYTDSLDLFSIASTWIIAVTLAISTTADVSGAHLNPAISIAFALLRPSKQFGWRKVLPYSIAQLVGAVLASAVNLAIYGTTIAAYEKANGVVRAAASGLASAKAFGEYYVDPVGAGVAFLAEAFGTGVLAFVIFSLTNRKNSTAKTGYVPLLIGATVGSMIATLAPLTQAGFNPARDFGPRIVAFLAGWKTVAFRGWWVYVFGPIVGAVVGATLADKVLHVDDDA
ncbi:MAG: hypothetical protein SGBAC_000347 [Bacillariaceae sp.]